MRLISFASFPLHSFVGGLGLAIAAALIGLLLILLRPAERPQFRLPLAFAILGGLFIVASQEITDGGAPPILALLALFFLLLSVARSTYLLSFRSVLAEKAGTFDVPRIVRDLIQGLLYAGVAIFTLHAGGTEPGSLLTTSALLTAVVGLSLQDTLGNLFAGLAIQAQQPFKVGDWIQYADGDPHIGRVLEMNWRAVKVQTLDETEITVPNNTLAKASLRNFTSPDTRTRRHIAIDIGYEHSPDRVIAELADAAATVPEVLKTPPPQVIVLDFTDSGVRYDIRYFINQFAERDRIAGDVRSRVWYAVQRMGAEFPFPHRVIQMYDYSEDRLKREEVARVEGRQAILRNVDFLASLSDDARKNLAIGSRVQLYAPGEIIVHEGDRGEEFFLIYRGEVRVEVGRKVRREVAKLGAGEFFGEMSLMTGADRRASVRSIRETELMVIDRAALRPVLEAEPALAEAISKVLAERAADLAANSHLDKTEPGLIMTTESGVLLDRIRKLFGLRKG